MRALVRRHFAAVPFENISKLLLRDREGDGRPISMAEYLDGIEYSDFGGTCYVLNPFLAELLRDLGYDAVLLGADMSTPDVHTCLRVTIDGLAYHVDVGFAAPLREPIRLDSLPVQVNEGTNRYVLDRERDKVRLSMFAGEKPDVGYLAHDPPRSREHFDRIVTDSFRVSSTFMRWLRVSRVFDTYSLDLTNRILHRHENGQTVVTELQTMAELKVAVAGQLSMQRCDVERAVAVLERHTGQPFFGQFSAGR